MASYEGELSTQELYKLFFYKKVCPDCRRSIKFPTVEKTPIAFLDKFKGQKVVIGTQKTSRLDIYRMEFDEEVLGEIMEGNFCMRTSILSYKN